jgi:hypothetical protein
MNSEGTFMAPFRVEFHHLPEETEEYYVNSQINMVGVALQIRNNHSPNTHQKH